MLSFIAACVLQNLNKLIAVWCFRQWINISCMLKLLE